MTTDPTTTLAAELGALASAIPAPLTEQIEAGIEAQGRSIHGLSVGAEAPDFELPNPDGKLVRLSERLADGPRPEVIVNRFEQRLFGPGLRRADIEQALGDSLAATVPNNFRLVSEAIDRGVPLDEVKAGNNISGALAKLLAPPKKQKSAATPAPALGGHKLALAR